MPFNSSIELSTPPFCLVAVVDNRLRHRAIALIGIRAQHAADLFPAGSSRIVKELALFRSCFPAGALLCKRLNDLVFALVERLFAGLLNVESDQDFVVRGRTIGLDAGIFQARARQFRMDSRRVGRMRILHVHQRPAAEVHAQRNAVPEQHGNNSRHAEDQRKGEKIPLLAEKIDVRIFKEFQVQTPDFQLRASSCELQRTLARELVARSSKLHF